MGKTMMLTFYYDVGRPNTYLAWKALSATPGVELDMRPVLIGGLFKSANNQPPWQSFGGVPLKMRYVMAEIARFADMYGLGEFAMNPHFPVNTLLAMRAATAARMDGHHEACVPALFAAMWEDAVDVSEPAELARVLDTAGLSGGALVARAGEPEVKAALKAATAEAHGRGVFGLPTWFTPEGEMYFGKDCCWMMHPGAERVVARRAVARRAVAGPYPGLRESWWVEGSSCRTRR